MRDVLLEEQVVAEQYRDPIPVESVQAATQTSGSAISSITSGSISVTNPGDGSRNLELPQNLSQGADVLFDSVNVSDKPATRSNLGLGGLATLSPAAASGDSAPAQSAAYVQGDVQAILNELRDLKAKLRSAGILLT